MAAAVAAALTTPTAKRYQLTIGGLDVLLQPGNPGNLYGVPIDSITIDWQGAGDVSALTCVLEDPAGVLAPTPDALDAAEVVMWNLVDGVPYFGGYLMDLRPSQVGTVMRYDVTCVGYEAILDWAQLDHDVTLPIGMAALDAVLAIAGQATPLYGLRVIGNAASIFSSDTAGVANLVDAAASGTLTLTYAVTIKAGATLRSALGQLLAATWTIAGAGINRVQATVTVDFLKQLRVQNAFATGNGYADVRQLSIAPTGADAAATDLQPERDLHDVIRAVFILGANAAGTGTVTDGTGKPGRTAYLNDPLVDSAAKLADRGGAYLAAVAAAWRGSFAIDSWTPVVDADVGPGPRQVRVDGPVDLTGYSWVGPAPRSYAIASITRTFPGGTFERWDVQYGGRAPSAMALIRRLVAGSTTQAAQQRP